MATGKKTNLLNIFVIVIVISLAIFITVSFFNKWHRSKISDARETEKVKYTKVIKELENNINDLETEIDLQKDTILPSEKINAVFNTNPQNKIDCGMIKNNVMAFFSYLDQKGYGSKIHSDKGTFGIYLNILPELANNKPVFSDKPDDILILLRSMSHLYRVLGKQNLQLLNEIIKNEPEMLEPALSSFYDWHYYSKKCNTENANRPSLETLYNYSCFFLNTIAGKSYMLRRSSKIRILTTYYCILIIDQANDETVNQYGYDIRQNITLLYDDIINHQQLLYKKEYIEKLNSILKKYPELK